jgi:hypothetical protein
MIEIHLGDIPLASPAFNESIKSRPRKTMSSLKPWQLPPNAMRGDVLKWRGASKDSI